MIVDPDFLDHWKTRLVVDLLGGDEFAPLYILRIWSHCQTRRKADDIEITAAGLRALCRCGTVPGEVLEAALIQAGFIARDGDAIRVIDWAERNARLVTAWENGRKGGQGNKGRKRKTATETEAEDDQTGTEHEPNTNPTRTETEPNGDRTESDGEAIRSRSRSREEEEEQEQKQDQKQKPARPAQRASDARALLLAEGVDEQTVTDWIAHRKAKRATASATVIEDRKRACAEAGVTLAEGLALEVSRGWQGLQAEWIRNARTNRAPQLPFTTAQDRARGWADIATGANNDDRRIIDITPTATPQLG